MHLVVSESRILTALHDVDLIEPLFSCGHHFHIADLFLAHRDIDAEVQLSLVSHGVFIEELAPGEMAQMVNLRRSNPRLCVGDAASLALSLSRKYSILVGNHGLATVPVATTHGLLDLCWVMDELEALVPVDQLHGCFETIIADNRSSLHSPGVASRLQRLSATANAPRA